MRNLLNRILGAGVLSIVLGCSSFNSNLRYNFFENPKIKNCFIKAHKIEYVDDGKTDSCQTPEETKKRKKGDCDDKAFYLQDCLLKEEKIKSEVFFGYLHLEHFFKRIGHAWVEYKWKGINYILDPTNNIRKANHKKEIYEFMPFSPEDRKKVELKINSFRKKCGIQRLGQ